MSESEGTHPHSTPAQPGTGDAPPLVPDHQLLRCIGCGSYGEVWLARSVLGVWRAVKIVHRNRFRDGRPYEREFQGILNIEPLSRSHEGLLDILHVGRHEPEGYFYYVMELADNANEDAEPADDHAKSAYQPLTLSEKLRRDGRLPYSSCLDVGLTLSGALAFLHQRGLIHRDVKPSNVLYVGGAPKLGDIGLVGEIGGSATYVGTQGYIPPEGPGTRQADIFSLGKVLYEACTGLDLQSFPSLPESLPEADRQGLAELNDVLLKACAPDPKDRYPNAEALNADLALLQSGQSVRRRRAREWRRHAVSLALYAAVFLVGIAVGALWAPLRSLISAEPASEKLAAAKKAEPVSLAAFYNASFTTNWMNDFAGNDMASLSPGLHVLGGIPFEARGLIQLRGKFTDPSSPFPAKIEGIPINRKCRRLHFLHSTHWHAEQRQCIATYVVHYADASEWQIPLSYGDEIGSWWRSPQQSRPDENVNIVWTGTNAPASASSRHEMLALYKTSWENPHPRLAITRVDFVSALTACSPFLLAITAE
jgi:serine/threonine protein kinase